MLASGRLRRRILRAVIHRMPILGPLRFLEHAIFGNHDLTAATVACVGSADD